MKNENTHFLTIKKSRKYILSKNKTNKEMAGRHLKMN